jgi:methylthioribose-1-phosphate isomerase
MKIQQIHTLSSLSLKFNLNSGLEILDQTLLPNQEVWVPIKSLDSMIQAIYSLQVRGAPLIGLSASLFWSHWLLDQNDPSVIKKGWEELKSSRPTAVNLKHNLESCWKSYEENPQDPKAALNQAIFLFQQDQDLCSRIAEIGSPLIEKGDQILTYCNTGGLATAGIGTALGLIKQAHLKKTSLSVYSAETRPLGQGARLTFWELQKAGIPVTLICDNMVGSLMQGKKISKVFVGADRICANGDTANKIGTYSLAVLAHYHHIPFYVVAPSTTFDFSLPTGSLIEIEQRPSSEILNLWKISHNDLDSTLDNHLSSDLDTPFKKSVKDSLTEKMSLKQHLAYNPGFDVTPGTLITKIISEKGIQDPCRLL